MEITLQAAAHVDSPWKRKSVEKHRHSSVPRRHNLFVDTILWYRMSPSLGAHKMQARPQDAGTAAIVGVVAPVSRIASGTPLQQLQLKANPPLHQTKEVAVHHVHAGQTIGLIRAYKD
eukprot:509106-Pelagomonas_calceolata.AAC.3